MTTEHGWLGKNGTAGLVSVVLPTYQRAHVVRDAVESVRLQQYRPLELIVVDDGSTDGTAEVLGTWLRTTACDAGLHVVCLFQQHAGAGAARNRGLVASRGEYLQFLDSDDTLPPQRFSRVVPLMDQGRYDYVYTGSSLVCHSCGSVLEVHSPTVSDRTPFELLCREQLWTVTIQFVFRRSLLTRVAPWNEELAVYQDFDYIVRALSESDSGIALAESLAQRHHHPGPRISDVRYSTFGLRAYLSGAQALCEGMLSHQMPDDVRSMYASRFLRQAVRLWPEDRDLAESYHSLADSLRCQVRGPRDRLEAAVWQAGPATRRLYAEAKAALKAVAARPAAPTQVHECQSTDAPVSN